MRSKVCCDEDILKRMLLMGNNLRVKKDFFLKKKGGEGGEVEGGWSGRVEREKVEGYLRNT